MKYNGNRSTEYGGENVHDSFIENIEPGRKIGEMKSHAVYTIEKNYIQYCFSCIPITFNGGSH
jgi:hypothetical protein